MTILMIIAPPAGDAFNFGEFMLLWNDHSLIIT